ncbi:MULTISPECIES: APC family permease [unclassified Streptomyces]|uniref:APC family permease n=1 Tax=unclassified Streptomyces TaxID=2593676 RepID=UPI00136EA459|nr:APC family permease [Streptomyces sp. SHP 1-2]MCW5251212.1 amino acid permease [Streptomyces sp. SHP 1-2]MYU23254.1 amino acid permease [Streptomyces sp. SID8352]
MNDPRTDAGDLAEYGYQQELKRTLSAWAVFAIGFATISPVVGIYAVVQLGFVFAGPAWIWAVVVAFLGQLLVATVYAELSSQFPMTGGVYQWVRRLGGPRLGWLTGWLYLASAVASLTTVAYLGASWLYMLFADGAPSPATHVLLGVVFVAVALGINLLGVNPVKHFLNAGIIAEGVASIAVSLILLVFARHNGFGILFETLGAENASGGSVLAGFLTCLAVAGWAFLGFDATTQVAEETEQPRRSVPRALLRAYLFVAFTVLLTGLAVTMALDKPRDAVAGALADPVFSAVTDGLGGWSEKPFILVVLIAFFACAISIQTYIGRAVFAFARDRQLPFSATLATIGPRQIPYVSLIATAVLAGLGLLLGLNGNAAATLIAFGSGGFYFIFLTVAVVALVARLTGRWNPAAGRLRLGRVGLVVNVAAVVWLLFEAVNIAWPRAELAPVGGSWVQTWAVILVFSALFVLGIAYVALAKPHTRLPRAAEARPTTEEMKAS